MPTEITLILIGLAVALAAILVLRFSRQIARFLLIAGGVVAVIAMALALTAQARATQQAARAATVAAAGQAATSAAMSLILFLLIVIVVLLLAIGGAVAAWLWWQRRQRQRQYRDTLQQAQVLALLNGQRPPALRRPARSSQMPGSPIIVVPGQQYPPAYPQYPPAVTMDDLRQALEALEGGRDPLAELMPPPNDNSWEVLE